jgi:hypothetical protein
MASTPPPPARSAKIPRNCYPNIGALMLLRDNTCGFDKRDSKALSDSDVGRNFARVAYNCRSFAEKYRTSQIEFASNSNSADAKQQVAKDKMELQSCLAARACPRRWQAFGKCWSIMPPELVQEFQEAGMVSFLCMSEKQAIERCVGNLVSQAVRQATIEDSEFNDDVMVIT